MNADSLDLALAPLLQAAAPEARESFAVELMELLGERAMRYTMGDSSSLPVETAERLLGSIAYCVQLHAQMHPGDQALPVKAQYEAGLKDVETLIRRGRALLHQAEASRSAVSSIAYEDTLRELPWFFKRYDYHVFAQEIPCDIDYPLCHPVPETLCGVSYVNEYLRRFCLENDLLNRMPALSLRALLENVHPDYASLVLNLYAPAAEAAVQRTLAESHGGTVFLRALPYRDAEAALRLAARQTAKRLSLSGALSIAYLEDAAADMLPRLLAAE